MFLNNVEFTYMPNTSSYFLNMPTEVKAALHSRIERDIEEGAIKPLPSKVRRKFETMKSRYYYRIYLFFNVTPESYE